jgi:hypothetical protein
MFFLHIELAPDLAVVKSKQSAIEKQTFHRCVPYLTIVW